ncbi:MAG: glycosyltransferase [Candidatus Moranbacteria bacterium]|jgi:glycosyltransferase involved in cell wall biosynthesis|nr:glycosyltransferase [Candidatus Moranbacteria bacterium]
MPKISVIMAAWNEQKIFLKKSIESILNQTFTDLEFIIIDNNSPEENSALLDSYAKKDNRIIIIRNKTNIGLTKSLNIAIKKSQGEFIARMDGDDISLPDRLSEQLSFLKKNPTIDIIGANCNFINKNDEIIKKKTIKRPSNIKTKLFKGNFFTHSTFFGKRKAFEELYNENFKRAQDYEFLLRLAGKGYEIDYLEDILLNYRINKDGVSFVNSKEQELFSLKARIIAILNYNYNPLLFPYILKGALSFLLPCKLKHLINFKALL